jgi:hypothetical protein
MPNFKYKDFPVIPEWLKDHIYKLIETSALPEISAHGNNYKDEFVKSAEKWISADQEILDIISDVEYNKEDTLGYHFEERDVHNYNKSLAFFDFLNVDKVITEWVEQNIPDKVAAINLQVMHGGELVTPHIDEIRQYALNYIFETGGDSVETAFYKPLAEYAHLKIYPRTLIPFDRIEKIESIIIETNRWHEINVQSIHSVDRLDTNKKRISLSLSVVR